METGGNRSSAVREAVAEAGALAQEQVSALWQLQIDRIREQLDSGWREHLEQIFNERFDEVRQRIENQFEQTVAERNREFATGESVRVRLAAAADAIERLNQTTRRMKQAESRDVWMQALLERASDYCGRAALFELKRDRLEFEAGVGFEDGEASTALAEAPAFAAAVENRDTIVTSVTAREVSAPIAQLVGEVEDKTAYLFPFSLRGRVAGVLYAEPGETPINVNGLEVLAALAESTLDHQGGSVVSDLVAIAPATVEPERGGLPVADQELHAKAERFARNRIANLMLFQITRVKQGRSANDLYATLKNEIDAGRESYRQQFLIGGAAVPDYFHRELVRTLAKNDVAALGSSYPGPLT